MINPSDKCDKLTVTIVTFKLFCAPPDSDRSTTARLPDIQPSGRQRRLQSVLRGVELVSKVSVPTSKPSAVAHAIFVQLSPCKLHTFYPTDSIARQI